jgi:hypothetical protein
LVEANQRIPFPFVEQSSPWVAEGVFAGYLSLLAAQVLYFEIEEIVVYLIVDFAIWDVCSDSEGRLHPAELLASF